MLARLFRLVAAVASFHALTPFCAHVPHQKGACWLRQLLAVRRRTWIRNKNKAGPPFFPVSPWHSVWSSQGLWSSDALIDSSLSSLHFLFSRDAFDVLDTLHLCYLTLPSPVPDIVRGLWCKVAFFFLSSFFCNLRSVHREIRYLHANCFFLLPLMWGAIACCTSARWEEKHFFSFFFFFSSPHLLLSSFMFVSFEAQKRKKKKKQWVEQRRSCCIAAVKID